MSIVDKKTARSDIPAHSGMMTGTMTYSAQTAQSTDERRLTVGRGIVLTGEINACDHLVVEGTVNASGLSTKRLDLQETGAFNGAATVQDATIAGAFDGKLVVSGRLVIKSTGRVVGDIEYGALEIESGSRIEARIAARATAEDNKSEQPKAPRKDAEAAGTGETTEERTGNFRRAVGY